MYKDLNKEYMGFIKGILPTISNVKLPLITKIDELVSKQVEETKADPKVKQKAKSSLIERKPYEEEYGYDRENKCETDEKTGFTLFKFSTNASFKDKEGNKVDKTLRIWNHNRELVNGDDFTYDIPMGATVRLRGFYNPYYMPATDSIGVSLKISAVQLGTLPEDRCDFDDDIEGNYTPTQSEVDEVSAVEDGEDW